jgi:hypothetical protein
VFFRDLPRERSSPFESARGALEQRARQVRLDGRANQRARLAVVPACPRTSIDVFRHGIRSASIRRIAMDHTPNSTDSKARRASASLRAARATRDVGAPRAFTMRACALGAARHARIASALVLCCSVAVAAQEHVKIPKPVQAMPELKTAPTHVPPRAIVPAQQRSAATTPIAPPLAPEVARPRVAPRLDPDEILYDTSADGAVWVHGASYKARFDGNGATYIPFLGSDAPHDYPVTFTLSSVVVGGEELALAASAATRADNIVTIHRGSVVEQYVMKPQSMEQEFVFESLASSGDLVLRIDVASELAGAEKSDGFEFANERGGVRYSRAVAIDARGNRCAATTTLQDGAIEIRVPAEVLARSAFPLTIDPVGLTFNVTSPGTVDTNPDIAYDTTHQVYAVTWERAFSASDHDCYCQLQNLFGVTVVNSTVSIDFTTAYWSFPRIANNANSSQFLVVATVGIANSRVIKGRTRQAADTTTSAQFQISDPSVTSDQFNADVGGDPTSTPPTYYFVTWERAYTTGDHDIFARLVDPGTALSAQIYVDDSSFTLDTHPSISKSDGDEPFSTQCWTIVWQREGGNNEIELAQYRWDGSVVHPSEAYLSGPNLLSLPCVSSITEGATGERIFLIAMQEQESTNKDILCVTGTGNAVQYIVNLQTLEGEITPLDHADPHVDSDGCDFAVTYAERQSAASGNYDVYVSTLNSLGSGMALMEGHQVLAGTADIEGVPRVTARHSGGGFGPFYAVTWQDVVTPSTSIDIKGAFYATPLATSFCRPGIDTSMSCPCSNLGTLGHGCNNSAGTGGGVMDAIGESSLGEDTLKLRQSGELPNSTSIVLQGGIKSPSVVFGAGLRCVGGTLKRLYTHNASNGTVIAPNGSDAPVHSRSAALGDTISVCQSRYYQIYYRDSNLAFCNGSGFNIGDAIAELWVP